MLFFFLLLLLHRSNNNNEKNRPSQIGLNSNCTNLVDIFSNFVCEYPAYIHYLMFTRQNAYIIVLKIVFSFVMCRCHRCDCEIILFLFFLRNFLMVLTVIRAIAKCFVRSFFNICLILGRFLLCLIIVMSLYENVFIDKHEIHMKS